MKILMPLAILALGAAVVGESVLLLHLYDQNRAAIAFAKDALGVAENAVGEAEFWRDVARSTRFTVQDERARCISERP